MQALAASGFVAVTGTATLARPALTLATYGPNVVAIKRPAAALIATGTAGTVGIGGIKRPRLSLESFASGAAESTHTALTRPSATLQGVGTTGSIAKVAAALRKQILAAAGVTGTVGIARVSLPLVQLEADGHGPMLGTVALWIPVARLQVTGLVSAATPSEPDGVEVPAIVMNSQTGALSHYRNFNFNAFAQFNGAALATNAEGLFLLTGPDDAGVPIEATAQGGISDFSTSFQKRIDRCYVGYRTDGNLVLRVRTDGTHARDYLMPTSQESGLHGNHARIGRGLAARYWQFEIRNDAGSYFSLNMIEVKATKLRRRIGGRDA
jgi:hypothetical protein